MCLLKYIALGIDSLPGGKSAPGERTERGLENGIQKFALCVFALVNFGLNALNLHESPSCVNGADCDDHDSESD